MDKAVLDAYGWSDLPTDCEFLLDYEIDEEEWGKKKKPDRYRWPDDVRDEFLARLLELKRPSARKKRPAPAPPQPGRVVPSEARSGNGRHPGRKPCSDTGKKNRHRNRVRTERRTPSVRGFAGTGVPVVRNNAILLTGWKP
jgi:hypothetical protein